MLLLGNLVVNVRSKYSEKQALSELIVTDCATKLDKLPIFWPKLYVTVKKK